MYAYALFGFGKFMVDKKGDDSDTDLVKEAITRFENTYGPKSSVVHGLKESANKYLTD